MKSIKRQKDRTLKDELTRSVVAQYTTGDQWRNNSRKNEEMDSKQKQCPFVDVTGDGSKVQWIKVNSVQSLSHVWLFVTSWIAACQASLFITNSRSSLKLMSIESVMSSSHLILCCPLFLLRSTFPTSGSFQMTSHQVAKILELQLQYQSFQRTPRTDLL